MVHAFYDVSLYRDSEAAVRAVAMQKEGPGFHFQLCQVLMCGDGSPADTGSVPPILQHTCLVTLFVTP